MSFVPSFPSMFHVTAIILTFSGLGAWGISGELTAAAFSKNVYFVAFGEMYSEVPFHSCLNFDTLLSFPVSSLSYFLFPK